MKVSGVNGVRPFVSRQGVKPEFVVVVAVLESDPEKLAMAARLLTETVPSIPRIAARIHLGSAKSAKAKLASWIKANARESAQSLRAEKKERKP